MTFNMTHLVWVFAGTCMQTELQSSFHITATHRPALQLNLALPQGAVAREIIKPILLYGLRLLGPKAYADFEVFLNYISVVLLQNE
jgi:hypothetical protein